MAETVTIVSESRITIDTAVAAQWFAHLSDEQQADFFIEVAKIASGWNPERGLWHDQFWYVGRHLRDCKCSTDDARELVKNLAAGLAAEAKAA